MNFNKNKCWYIKTAVYDIDALGQEAHDIDLMKKSILKNGYRAYCFNDREEIEKSEWYRNYLLGEKTLFYIGGSGIYKLSNVDLVENELYFEKDNLPVGFRPWIFYSWQSDYNPSRSHIGEALDELIAYLNTNRNPKATLEKVESTRPEDGAGDIVEAIKQNIDRCLIAVFDITNVAGVLGDNNNAAKSYPNANVIFELSYAIQRKRKDQVILVRRTRDDIGNDEVPFDFRQLRHIAYSSAGQAKSSIRDTVTQNLTKLNFITAS